MTKTYTKLFRKNNCAITITNPDGCIYELITTYGGFIKDKNNDRNYIILNFYHEIPSDDDIIKSFFGELNAIGYKLVQGEME